MSKIAIDKDPQRNEVIGGGEDLLQALRVFNVERARQALGQIAATRMRIYELAEETLAEQCMTPETTTRIQELGEAIFSIPRRAYGVTMLLGEDQHFLQDRNLKRLAWRDLTRQPWSTVIIERVKRSDGSFQYRIHEPRKDSLSDRGWLKNKPDLEKTIVLADSHHIVFNGTGKNGSGEEDELRLCQASVKKFEEICKVITWGSEEEDILDIVTNEKTYLLST